MIGSVVSFCRAKRLPVECFFHFLRGWKRARCQCRCPQERTDAAILINWTEGSHICCMLRRLPVSQFCSPRGRLFPGFLSSCLPV